MPGIIYDETNYQPTPEQLAKWKSTGIIENFQGERLDLSESKGWKEQITIKNCPNLKYLNIFGLNPPKLEEVDLRELHAQYANGAYTFLKTGKISSLTIDNCPNLEYLDASCNKLNDFFVYQNSGNKLKVINLNNNKFTYFDADNFPNLEHLNLDHNKLHSINLKKHKELRNFSCSNNSLTTLDLAENTKLWKLTVNHNLLAELKVNHLTELKELYCFENRLTELDCSGLSKLWILACHKNRLKTNSQIIEELHREEIRAIRDKYKARAQELKRKKEELVDLQELQELLREGVPEEEWGEEDRVDLQKLKEGYENDEQENKDDEDLEIKCFNIEAFPDMCEYLKENGIKMCLYKLDLRGCENSLQVLDIDCNSLVDINNTGTLSFIGFKKLENISLMYNGGLAIRGDNTTRWVIPDAPLLFKNCPNLMMLNYYGSNANNLQIENCPNLKPENVIDNSEKTKRWLEGFKGQDIPRWQEEVDRIYRERQAAIERVLNSPDKQKQEEIERAKQLLGIYEGQQFLDLSHQKYTDIVLNGNTYPQSIEFINLGNNNLQTLFLADFPNLQTLILAHNALEKPLIKLSKEEYLAQTAAGTFNETKNQYGVIVNCPKVNLAHFLIDSDDLKNKTVYGYKHNDPSRKSKEERVYDDKLDNPYLQATVLNELLTNPTQHSCEEWAEKLNWETVPLMQRGELLEALQQKRQEEKEAEEKEDRRWWENYHQEWAALEAEEKKESKKQFAELLEQAQAAVNKGDYEQLGSLLTKLNKLCQVITPEQQTVMQQLAQKYNQFTETQQKNIKPNDNLAGYFLTWFFILVALGALLINKDKLTVRLFSKRSKK